LKIWTEELYIDLVESENSQETDECEDDLVECRAKNAWFNLPNGCVACDFPKEMVVGILKRVEVNVARETTEELGRSLKTAGKLVKLDIRVSPKMKANLDGKKDFEIHRLCSDEQALLDSYTQWAWEITPLRSGLKDLNLFMEVVLEIKGFKDRKRKVCERKQVIKVKFNPSFQVKRFIEKQWQWIIGTIVAVVSVIIAWKKIGG
jgi:hypothetical protein